MSKRPQSEQEKFKPSYESTSFTEYPLESLYSDFSAGNGNTSSVRSSPPSSPPNLPFSSDDKNRRSPESQGQEKRSPSYSEERETDQLFNFSLSSLPELGLSSDATSDDTANWLAYHRFDAHIRTLSNFSGGDILKLTRNDLIQICGLTDGIRLFNALHIRSVKPKMTLYVCNPVDQVFRAIYLENLEVPELTHKLASIFLGSNDCYIKRLCLLGPSGIKVLMTNEVVRNFSEESIFLVQFDRGK